MMLEARWTVGENVVFVCSKRSIIIKLPVKGKIEKCGRSFQQIVRHLLGVEGKIVEIDSLMYCLNRLGDFDFFVDIHELSKLDWSEVFALLFTC